MAQSSTQFEADKFFSNRACKHFPCHEGIDPDRFNCLMCYCPLYTLGEACGGKYTYTEKGVKNCKECPIPHDGDTGVELVRSHFRELSELAARQRDGQ